MVFSDFGLKLTIFKLDNRASIDIPGLKLFSANTAKKGYAYRPTTRHLALLTRTGGKDVISVHEKNSYKVLRSWNPESVDAQLITWSPDGKWLLVVESASQGHKLLVHTADGHLFKTWKGPRPIGIEEADLEFGAGIKMMEWARNGRHLAVGDFTDAITILSVPAFTETMRLRHVMTLHPAESLDVWQEQVLSRAQATLSGQPQRLYAKIMAITAPPTASVSPKSSTTDVATKSGTISLAIDASGTLIASRIEALPTSVFVWDTVSKILKAVLIQNSPVVKLTWHATINELLLIQCEGDDTKSIAYLWEPSYEVPRIIDFSTQLPDGNVIGKILLKWLISESETIPVLFFSDTQDAILAAVTDDADEDVPWNEAAVTPPEIERQEESPLNLVDEPYEDDGMPGDKRDEDEPSLNSFEEGDTAEMDDTFQFKKTGRI